MTNMNNFSLITSIIVTVAVLALTGYIIPTLKQRLGEDKVVELKRLITLAVRYAEQVFTPDQWAEKKRADHDYICEKAVSVGLSEKDLDVLIEACVHEVKKG